MPTNITDTFTNIPQCALWGFNGGDTRMGNPYQSIHVDTLHHSDIGIFKMMVGIYREIAEATPRLQILEKIDQRLSEIKHSCRFPGFRIPGNDQGGYFCSPANFAGFDHRSVMQVCTYSSQKTSNSMGLDFSCQKVFAEIALAKNFQSTKDDC